MEKIDLAIIIPTLNEEKYIGKLLDSILAQTVKPEELVIVDAQSHDKTIDEIKKRQNVLPQLKYFQIPRYTIARQRNFGAKKTASNNLLFLDADTKLKDPEALKTYLEEINKTNPDIATAPILPLSDYWKNKIFYQASWLLIKFSKNIWPIAVGINLYVSRKMFNKINGFDDEVKIGEDVEIVHRVVENGGKFDILDKPQIYTSARRFEKEGRRSFALKMAKAFYYVNTKGFKNNPINYDLGNHE